MPAPHADFACLSKHCDTADGASVYDLPVSATRCPVCGSKRLRRLFNAVNVGKPDARAHAKLLEGSSLPAQLDQAREQRDARLEAEKRESPVLKLGAGGALGAVQSFPGAALYSRGGVTPKGERIVGAVDVLRSVCKLPKPGAYRE